MVMVKSDLCMKQRSEIRVVAVVVVVVVGVVSKLCHGPFKESFAMSNVATHEVIIINYYYYYYYYD